MNPDFLPLLRCPTTASALNLDAHEWTDDGFVKTGSLVNEIGGEWPVRGGVPRFVPDPQQTGVESFGHEWHRWARTQFETENAGGPMAGHTTHMWEQICDPPPSLEGTTIVDFGCGPGRFVDVARARGARVVGLELSSAADVARANFRDDPNVLIVQGDLLRPPFARGAFDAGFSIGVLHHTPDPGGGVTALARSIRSGGWLACCVYPKGEFYDYASVRRMRELHLRLQPVVGYRFAAAYSRFAAYGLAPVLGRARAIPGIGAVVRRLERGWLPFLELPDRRWGTLDVFDAITPEIATTHEPEDLEAWLSGAGCTEIRRTPWASTSAVATVA